MSQVMAAAAMRSLELAGVSMVGRLARKHKHCFPAGISWVTLSLKTGLSWRAGT